MTQELIANMLGVRREGVTDAAGKLQGLDVILTGINPPLSEASGSNAPSRYARPPIRGVPATLASRTFALFNQCRAFCSAAFACDTLPVSRNAMDFVTHSYARRVACTFAAPWA